MTREYFAFAVIERVANAEDWQPIKAELMDMIDEHDISKRTAYRVIDGLIFEEVLYLNANAELELSPEARTRIKEMQGELDS